MLYINPNGTDGKDWRISDEESTNEINKLINILVVTKNKKLFKVTWVARGAGAFSREKKWLVEGFLVTMEAEEVRGIMETQAAVVCKDVTRAWVVRKGVVQLVIKGVPLEKDLCTITGLLQALRKENPGVIMNGRWLERIGRDKEQNGRAYRSTPVRVEARDAEEAGRWIKGGLMVGGKEREVEL